MQFFNLANFGHTMLQARYAPASMSHDDYSDRPSLVCITWKQIKMP